MYSLEIIRTVTFVVMYTCRLLNKYCTCGQLPIYYINKQYRYCLFFIHTCCAIVYSHDNNLFKFNTQNCKYILSFVFYFILFC